MHVAMVYISCILMAGDLLQLGASAVFRFNNPHEAAKLRRRQSVSPCLYCVLYKVMVNMGVGMGGGGMVL